MSIDTLFDTTAPVVLRGYPVLVTVEAAFGVTVFSLQGSPTACARTVAQLKFEHADAEFDDALELDNGEVSVRGRRSVSDL